MTPGTFHLLLRDFFAFVAISPLCGVWSDAATVHQKNDHSFRTHTKMWKINWNLAREDRPVFRLDAPWLPMFYPLPLEAASNSPQLSSTYGLSLTPTISCFTPSHIPKDSFVAFSLSQIIHNLIMTVRFFFVPTRPRIADIFLDFPL
jgi:hypothetical protein